MATASSVNILNIADEIWMSTFYYLPIGDFVSMEKTCHYFHNLSNDNKFYNFSSKYWKHQCCYLWSKIESSKFNTNDWKTFCRDLIQSGKDICKINGYQCKLNIINNSNNCKYNCQENMIDKCINQCEQDTNDESCIANICSWDLLPLFKVLICNMTDEQINTPIRQLKYELSSKHTMLSIAIEGNSFKIINFLLGYTYCNNKDAKLKKYNFVNLDVNGEYLDDHPPLVTACYDKQIDTVRLLLNHPNMSKKGVNNRDAGMVTALHCACIMNWSKDEEQPKEIVEMLLNDKRTDVNLEDLTGQTALFSAIKEGYDEIVSLMIENKNIDVNVQDNKSQTPLHFAINRYLGFGVWEITNKNTYYGIIKKLLTRTDLNLSHTDYKGRTPLQLVPQSETALLDLFCINECNTTC